MVETASPASSARPAAIRKDGGLATAGSSALDAAACTPVIAGTIFDRTRTPLTVWFSACWYFASGKDGISALSLKRTLEIGSYQTVWAILHRLRSVLICPDPGAPLREGGGGRNLHRRQGIRTFGRPCQREEDPDVYRDRDPGAEGIRALSNGAGGGCLLRIASLLRVG